jgi:glycosyltransferase involved in cell wall biosynthesis
VSEDGRRDRVLSLAWLAARHPVGVLRDLAPAARRASRFALRSPARALRRGCGARRDAPGKLLGKPSSFATHGYDIFQRPANHVEKHERAAFAVSACHYSASHLRGVVGGEAATRIHRLMVGVDGERFRRRRPYPGASTVKAVGRLVEKKGLADLVDAVALMRDRDSGLRLRIVGDGPLRPALEHKVDELGAGDSIQLLGARTHEDVRDLLEEADVLAMQCVVAADGDRDTMPVVVKEALAMEIAVVATEEVGLPEVVKPGWGRLVPPHDPAALAAALDEVLAMPASDRVGMGRGGVSSC